MSTQLCINILIFKQKHKKCQNESLWTIKHVFMHDYFLHMRPALGVGNFEPNEYKQLVKW
jgi:hypothetical protein